MKRRTWFNNKGFTLIEIGAALTILVFAAAFLTQIFQRGTRVIADSEKSIAPVTTASTRMEEILNQKLEERSWSETTDDGYHIDISIEETEKDKTANMAAKMMHVALDVYWVEGTRTKKVRLNSLKMFYATDLEHKDRLRDQRIW